VDFKVALTRRETGATLGSSFGLNEFRVVPFLAISAPSNPAGPGGAEAAALDVARRQRELRAAETRAEIEIRRAVRQQQRLLHSLASAEDSVVFADKQVDVARVRFERGLSDNLDLVSAEADLLAAQSRRSSVAAALAVATLQVKAAMGTLNLASDFEQQR
jgi:outer membrane protein TolC